MVFSSIEFLCLFLPIVIIIYGLCPAKMRNIVLLIFSLIFYAWGEPKYLAIMVASIVINYAFALIIEKNEEKPTARKVSLSLSIICNLGILSFFKYTDFVIANINNVAGTSFGLLEVALPIGISFYTFQAMSYTIDVYRKEVKAQHNIINFGMYISMFPQLIAGPIVRYSHIENQISCRELNVDRVYEGIRRFVIGLGKKVILANQVGLLWDEVYSYGGQMDIGLAWLGAIFFSFQIYFDFSGYSDMAIGLGKIFGFDFPENFNYPYTSKSITEFWRRWHMTLSGWFRSYLYIPLGGNKKGLKRQILNLFIVWSLTGLWHGSNWNFVIWGLYFFLILMVEKLGLLKILEKMPPIIGHVYSCILIAFSWVIFACDDMEILGKYVRSLVGLSKVTSGMTSYYFTTAIILILIMAVGSTKGPKTLVSKCKDLVISKANEKVWIGIEIIGIMVIMAVSIILLVAGSYNPFLYFRF